MWILWQLPRLKHSCVSQATYTAMQSFTNTLANVWRNENIVPQTFEAKFNLPLKIFRKYNNSSTKRERQILNELV
jgi:hypothetical protein